MRSVSAGCRLENESSCLDFIADPVYLTPDCIYLPGFLNTVYASALLTNFWSDLECEQKPIKLFGRSLLQPRLICWQGDTEAVYGYSGIRLEPEPWHSKMLVLRNLLQKKTGLYFNSVLANAYRNGQDSMGWHSDDEAELGPKPAIASLSLGAIRIFRYRNKRSRVSASVELEHGSLLLMSGDFQREFQHCVPKTSKEKGLRINLTFRKVIAAQKFAAPPDRQALA